MYLCIRFWHLTQTADAVSEIIINIKKVIKKMEKIFHKHLASVMQDALAVFRLNNARVGPLIH